MADHTVIPITAGLGRTNNLAYLPQVFWHLLASGN